MALVFSRRQLFHRWRWGGVADVEIQSEVDGSRLQGEGEEGERDKVITGFRETEMARAFGSQVSSNAPFQPQAVDSSVQ